ncbi:MAG: acyl-CoA thioesterase [Nitrospira sp.]|nr:acyl-CoA thioesterase [Nitrospira sp.]
MFWRQSQAILDAMSLLPTDRQPLLTQLTFTPKTYEIDRSGVLSNLALLKWLEDLRPAMLSHYMPFLDLLNNDTTPAIAITEIQYKRPILLFDTLVGTAWVKSLGRTTWELSIAFTIVECNWIAVEATQQGVFVNITTKRPVRVPERLTTLFEQDFADSSMNPDPS